MKKYDYISKLLALSSHQSQIKQYFIYNYVKQRKAGSPHILTKAETRN